MPDAHVGYGLPIGGVLATRHAVIPYAVGVDIACRVRLSVFDPRTLPVQALESQGDRLVQAIERETRFGMGASFDARRGERRREHPVLDEDWSVSPVTRQHKDKAAAQLGTSGSGNHFVEFGVLSVPPESAAALQLPRAGKYLALLSHSGSRGEGAMVCQHYSRLAMQLHPKLPREARRLAWLDLDAPEGREYWDAMNLMGRYAHANHACIHDAIARRLKAEVVAVVENHHNFAWRERHVIDPRFGEEELIVHRKGATPAAAGVLGVIPGSMAAPGFVVRGKGQPASLHSAAHGAGRVMSRTRALQTFRWNQVRPVLEEAGVRVLSAGLDEAPGVYKDIHAVMAAQADLVEPLARFDPRLVKMAPQGEKAED